MGGPGGPGGPGGLGGPGGEAGHQKMLQNNHQDYMQQPPSHQPTQQQTFDQFNRDQNSYSRVSSEDIEKFFNGPLRVVLGWCKGYHGKCCNSHGMNMYANLHQTRLPFRHVSDGEKVHPRTAEHWIFGGKTDRNSKLSNRFSFLLAAVSGFASGRMRVHIGFQNSI